MRHRTPDALLSAAAAGPSARPTAILISWAPAGARVAKEYRHLRIGAVTLAAWSGALALTWAAAVMGASAVGTSTASPPAVGPSTTSSSTPPSIHILRQQPGLAGTCGGGSFDVSTFINVGTQASADVKLSAPGVGILAEFTDETGKNIGPYNAKFPTFQIPAFGGGLAPNTLITVTVTTYSGPGLTGVATFKSKIVFNCTTGQVLLNAVDPTAPIPTLSLPALFASMALVALLGAAALRRSRPARQKS